MCKDSPVNKSNYTASKIKCILYLKIFENRKMSFFFYINLRYMCNRTMFPDLKSLPLIFLLMPRPTFLHYTMCIHILGFILLFYTIKNLKTPQFSDILWRIRDRKVLLSELQFLFKYQCNR